MDEKNTRKKIIIGTIIVAVIAIAVVIGTLLVKGNSSNKNENRLLKPENTRIEDRPSET